MLSYFIKQLPVCVSMFALPMLPLHHSALSVNIIELLQKCDSWLYWLSAAITGRPCLFQIMLLVTVGAAEHHRSWRNLHFTEEKQLIILDRPSDPRNFESHEQMRLLLLMSEKSRKPVKLLRWVKGFRDSLTADENRTSPPFIMHGEVWTPTCCVYVITLLLLSPCWSQMENIFCNICRKITLICFHVRLHPWHARTYKVSCPCRKLGLGF